MHQPTRHPAARRGARLSRQDGEGVISTAIAVLIMAFIGAAMWVVFNGVFENAAENVEVEVGRIGES